MQGIAISSQPSPVTGPVEFRSKHPNYICKFRGKNGETRGINFRNGLHITSDPEEIAVLRGLVTLETRGGNYGVTESLSSSMPTTPPLTGPINAQFSVPGPDGRPVDLSPITFYATGESWGELSKTIGELLSRQMNLHNGLNTSTTPIPGLSYPPGVRSANFEPVEEEEVGESVDYSPAPEGFLGEMPYDKAVDEAGNKLRGRAQLRPSSNKEQVEQLSPLEVAARIGQR